MPQQTTSHAIDRTAPVAARNDAAARAEALIEQISREVPERMLQTPHWLLWRVIGAADQPRKVPFYSDGGPRTGTLDSPEDRARLASFDAACAAIRHNPQRWSGLGFALGQDAEGQCWQGVDFDDLSQHPQLRALIDTLPGYVESSPSGDGVHAVGLGPAFATLASNASGIEAYSAKRYFTVTGEGLQGELADLSDYVATVLAPLHQAAVAGQHRQHAEPRSEQQAVGGGITSEQLEDLRSALHALDADDYSTWIAAGHALRALGDPGYTLWCSWSQTSAKWRPEDARRWASFRGERSGYQAVFAMAQRAGWSNPRRRPATAKAHTSASAPSLSLAEAERLTAWFWDHHRPLPAPSSCPSLFPAEGSSGSSMHLRSAVSEASTQTAPWLQLAWLAGRRERFLSSVEQWVTKRRQRGGSHRDSRYHAAAGRAGLAAARLDALDHRG